jgi:hypothetical protein
MSPQSEIVEPDFGCSACVLAAAGAPETGPESHAPMCPHRWEDPS